MGNDFTLRLPFYLGPGVRIGDLEGGSAKLLLAGKPCSISRLDDLHVLNISGFADRKDAASFLIQAWAGMAWAAIQFNSGFKARLDLDEIKYAPNPAKCAENLGLSGQLVDGIVQSDMPAIYPSNKRIRTITFQGSGHSAPIDLQNFFETVNKGMERVDSSAITSDPKILTALDLYHAYQFERSPSAKLLTLVMVLESLTTPRPKAEAAQELLNKWRAELSQKLAEISISQEHRADRESIEALERELFFRKDDSLRQSVKILVRETLKAVDVPLADEYAQLALKVYDKRSTLSHEGKLESSELDKALCDAHKIVEAVLKAKLIAKRKDSV